MLVFARVGTMSPDDATPAPSAGAVSPDIGLAGVRLPLGVIPKAPCSRLVVCA